MTDAQDFLHALFGTSQQGYITLSAFHSNGDKPSPSRHILVTDQQALKQALSDLQHANRLGWHATFSIGLRRGVLGRWRRGGKADVLSLPALCADLDAPPALARPRLERFEPRYSLLVGSGHGLHAYWLLAEPTHNLGKVDLVLKGLASALNGDRVTIASAMRLPGTTNWKQPPTRCELLDLHPDRRYTLHDFDVFAEPPQPKRPPAQLRKPPYDRDDQRATITDILLREYEGRWQRNGWLGALCPCGHTHDRPGQHFGWHKTYGVGHCFGRHGTLSTQFLSSILNL